MFASFATSNATCCAYSSPSAGRADAPPVSAFPDPPRGGGYRLIDRRDRDLLFVIDREVVKTPDLMAKLERAFDKRLTTRNWSTMEKVAAALLV